MLIKSSYDAFFENLLINAINHAPRHTQVEVALSTVGSQQQLQIGDYGPGINADEITDLFERFYQGYSHRQTQGSGLGLYLSRQIVEAHNGKIWAENRAFSGSSAGHSKGAIFSCCLPALLATL